MRAWAVFASLSLVVSMGCDGKLNVGSNTSVTTIARNDTPGQKNVVRFWAVDLGGTLYTYRSDTFEKLGWTREGTPDGVPAINGVSAVSWDEAGVHHERGYYVNTNGGMFGRAIDGESSRSWITADITGASSGPLRGAPITLHDATFGTFVGAINQGGTLYEFQEVGTSAQSFILGSPRNGIAATSPVVGTTSNVDRAGKVRRCYFVRSGGGIGVHQQNLGWFEAGLPNVNSAVTNASDTMTAVSGPSTFPGLNPTVSLFVRDTTGRLWYGAFAQDCRDLPSWTNLETPGTPIAAFTGAISVSAHFGNPLAPNNIALDVVVAGTDGRLYARTLIPDQRILGVWASRGTPSDTLGALGGITAYADKDVTRSFFVGNVSGATQFIPATGFAFEQFDVTPTRSMTDPTIGLVRVNPVGSRWTESHLAERAGRILVAAMDIDDTRALLPQRVDLGFSTDDGHSWSNSSVPAQFSGLTAQGDPVTAIDSTGRAYALLHEVQVADCSPAGPGFTASMMYVVSTMDGTTYTAAARPSFWLSSTNAIFLDHPSMTITSDDVQHFVWFEDSATESLQGLDYTSRRGSTWGTRQTFYRHPMGDGLPPRGPVLLHDAADALYVFWFTQGGLHRLPFCALAPGVGCTTLTDVSAKADACANTPQLSTTGAAPKLIRAGHGDMTASPSEAGHVVAVFQTVEGNAGSGVAASGDLRACDIAGHLDIAFTESLDGGQTWTPAKILSATPADGIDQFMPSVGMQADGTVIATFYEREGAEGARQRIAVRKPEATDWLFGIRQPSAEMQLTALPHKCADPADQVFLGDYHYARSSGGTHVHGIRVDPNGQTNDRVRLHAYAISGDNWH